MQESTKRSENNTDDNADATSTETVADLNENEVSRPSSSEPGPSPDGALDETGEIQKADPV